jgi:RNA polymerase sigma factor (sigma-70 family)
MTSQKPMNSGKEQPYGGVELRLIAMIYVRSTFSLPPDMEEDAVSAFVTAALEAKERAVPGVGIRSYQYRAGRWGAARFIRKWDRYRALAMVSLNILMEEKNDEEGMPDASAASPLEILIQKENAEKIEKAMGALPERQRKIVELRVLKEKTFEEIAEEMKLTRSWVCRIYASAVKRLREELRELSDFA